MASGIKAVRNNTIQRICLIKVNTGLKYADILWYKPMPDPFNEKGIAGLYYPLSNYTITKDDIVDLVRKYVRNHHLINANKEE